MEINYTVGNIEKYLDVVITSRKEQRQWSYKQERGVRYIEKLKRIKPTKSSQLFIISMSQQF